MEKIQVWLTQLSLGEQIAIGSIVAFALIATATALAMRRRKKRMMLHEEFLQELSLGAEAIASHVFPPPIK